MNARRVHDLMRERFPAFEVAQQNWVNVADRDGPRTTVLAALLEKYIASPDVIVEVHRKLGARLPKEEATSFICSHLGEGQIKVADPAFTSFLVVAINGVATGWQVGPEQETRQQ